MKKATQKPVAVPAAAAPITLGTKRYCPKCSTKFYDFNKSPIMCPKCDEEIDADAHIPVPRAPEPKRPKSAERTTTDGLAQPEDLELGSDDAFESVDDLGDDEDEVVDDLDVDKDDGDEDT